MNNDDCIFHILLSHYKYITMLQYRFLRSFFCYFALISFLFLGVTAYGQEVCDNGMDDDGDGLIDLNDIADCGCADTLPLTEFANLICTEFNSFAASFDVGIDNDYKWYKDGIAMGLENDFLLAVFGDFDGVYQCLATFPGGCRISEPLIISVPDYEVMLQDTFCESETYMFGDATLTSSGSYTQFLTAQNGCDSLIYLDLVQEYCGDTVRFFDKDLKRVLVEAGVDLNGDGSIQFTEAAEVDSITFHTRSELWNKQVTDLRGIESFVSLRYLDASDNDLKRALLDTLFKLEYLDLSQNPYLTEIVIDSMSELRYLNISSCSSIDFFEDADITNNSKLETYINKTSRIRDLIDFSNCPLLREIDLTLMLSGDTFSVSQNPLLERFTVTSGGDLETFDFTNNPNLTYLYISQVGMPMGIDLSKNTELDTVFFQYNFMDSINLSNNTKLKRLTFMNNQITDIDISANTALEYVDLSNNTSLENVVLGENNLVSYFDVHRTDIVDLDLSSCHVLDSLFVANPKIINIKNGSVERFLDFGFGFFFEYVCVDDEQYDDVRAMLPDNVSVNSYCYFTPGGTPYSVTGQLYYDANESGCTDQTHLVPEVKFLIDDGTNSGYSIKYQGDQYSVDLTEGSTTVRPIFENDQLFTIEPPTVQVLFPEETSPRTQDFCIRPNELATDMSIALIPITTARPGFEARYKLKYKNIGTTSLSSQIELFYADGLTYQTSTREPVTNEGQRLSWMYDAQPFEEGEVVVTFKLNTPTDDFPLNDGDMLVFEAKVWGPEDIDRENNVVTLAQPVVNSYDPNDKQCIEGTVLPIDKVGEYVHYLIRFENIGSASAINVVVKDTIDPALFDISSLRPIDASHAYTTRIHSGNIVEFAFEEIELGYTDDDNDGYICFKVRSKSDLVNGSILLNDAEIYFDYNLPIYTAEYATLIDAAVNTSDKQLVLPTLRVHPSLLHVGDLFMVEYSQTTDVTVHIYDMAGMLQSSFTGRTNEPFVSTNGLSRGVYLVRLETAFGTSSTRIFVQ